MADPAQTLSAPEMLALAYVPAPLKAGFSLLLRFDRRIMEIVLKEGEPLAAQLRLAWWRDALSGAVEARPRGEPMLAELGVVEAQGSHPGLALSMMAVLDAWSVLLAHETWSNDVIEEFASARAEGLFGSYRRWSAWRDDVIPAGVAWARNELAVVSGQADLEAVDVSGKLPRPLSILAMAARQQRAPRRLSGLRLALHGLTGL